MAAESRNKAEARREENGVVYYDRGILKGTMEKAISAMRFKRILSK